VKGSKQFFFGKKNQKTFARKELAVPYRAPKPANVFCFFSSEKKALSFLNLWHSHAALHRRAFAELR
jgi:hypothetical protein